MALEPRLTVDYRWGRLYGLTRAHPDTIALGVSGNTAIEIQGASATVIGRLSVVSAVVSIVVVLTVVATTVVYARAWRLASVPLRLVLPPSALLLRELTGQAITAPRRSVVHTATIIMRPTTAAYPRHSCCNTGGHR